MKQPNPPARFEFLAFGDMHVNANTLSRSTRVLRMLGQVAKAKNIPIVCTGDFWDARGVLATRQVDAVLSEIEEWRTNGVKAIFVPGNHDQVSMRGDIHAMRIFDAFDNVIVATEPIMDEATRCAFIPWREDPQDQSNIFNLPAPGNWTIFGHAEVKGSVGNNGHKAAGRVTLTQINAVSRACYLGHYHKRQKIGDRTWYLGNPFELNMGERGQPKGIAHITSESVDPTFIELPGFAKHHRIDLRAAVAMPAIALGDVVEVSGFKSQLQDPQMQDWMASLPTQDVRQKPVADEEIDAPPAMGNTVEEAIDTWAGDDSELAELGKQILDEARNHEAQTEPLGSKTRILNVTGRDFCGLRGAFALPLENQGAVMLRGPQGCGKTALLDAISWCLFEKTSPRKASGDSASMKGDEVIHDAADDTSVTVTIEVDGERYDVRRNKTRGKGARVRVKGPSTRPDGIADENAWVEALVGVPYPLWRACVSLGQGAVANFLTQTDKHRKALLSDAHGLGVCVHARKITKKRMVASETRLKDYRTRLATVEGILSHMHAQDFDTEAAQWDANKEANKENAAERLDALDDEIIKMERALESVPDISEQMAEVDERMEAVTTALGRSPKANAHRDDLQKQIGMAQAEISLLERERNQLIAATQALVATAQGKAAGLCPTCNQSWSHASIDHHVKESEDKVKSKEFEINTLRTRISNHEMALAGLTGSDSTERERLAAELKDLQKSKDTLNKTSSTVTTIQAKLDNYRTTRQETQSQLDSWDDQENPFRARAEAHERDIEMKEADRDNLQEDVEEEFEDFTMLQKWYEGFGQNGLPVVVMRAAMGDLEATANEYLGKLSEGKIWTELSLSGDTLDVKFHKYDTEDRVWRPRRYEQLSGGERRCAELAFSPFGLSEMLFRRLKCKVPFMAIDELTTHLGAHQKTIACDIIHGMDRETVLVIDHDRSVQAEFDVVYEVSKDAMGKTKMKRD